MKFFLWTFITAALVFTMGCAMYQAPVMPPAGLIFTNTAAPIDIDAEKTDMGNKIGKASSISILSLFSFGDCSINSAARNGDLQTINHSDYTYTNVFGIYQRFTTIAYGD